ncbi:MAG: choice-of-anchor D domain-containing protein [Bacteroidota bacterium]|nr:choice-of-anchor D domain-containing protein [Candidatus Kapabacteria bacterium]MDW8220438.1 choice-of-anchor D domain-containing protein [Bacteroidota bacterium]
MAERFPRMRAHVYAFDANGRQVSNVRDIVLEENGVRRMITSYTCPEKQFQPMSVVLAIDVSGSMSVREGSTTRLQIAQEAAQAFISVLPEDGSECGVVAFETASYIVQDFTTNKALLRSAVNALRPLAGTDYERAFLDNPGGALPLFAQAVHTNRAIIFLTDGEASARADEIVQRARQFGVKVYCITLGMNMPAVLSDIARQTGGVSFANIRTASQAIQVYYTIAGRIRQNSPCVLEWMSDIPCLYELRTVRIAYQGTQAFDRYMPPRVMDTELSIQPRIIVFGPVLQATRQVAFQVLAGGMPLTIRSIRSSDSAFKVRAENITLVPGVPRMISVEYSANDSAYRFATLTVETSHGCSMELYATAGFPGIRPRVPTLRLVRPNGGEVFLVGTTTTISWTGVSPAEPVVLDYSTDAGKTWRVVDTAAQGLSRVWVVPNTPSQQCYMRVRQKNTNATTYSGDSCIALVQYERKHVQPVHSAVFSPDGRYVVSAGRDNSVVLWYGRDSLLGRGFAAMSSSSAARYADYSRSGDIIVGLNDHRDNAAFIQAPIASGIRLLGSVFQTFPNAAVRMVHASPANRYRFLAISDDQIRSGIAICDPREQRADKRLGELILSTGARVARYTNPFTLTVPTQQGAQRVFVHGIVAAMNTADSRVRAWIFTNGDENTSGNPIIPTLSALPPTIQPLYVDGVPFSERGTSMNDNLRIAVAYSNRVRFLKIGLVGSELRLVEDETLPEMILPVRTDITMLSFSPRGDYLAIVAGTQVYIWQLGASFPETILNTPTSRMPHKSSINTAFFSPDGARIVTASNDTDTNLVVWMLREKLPLQEDRSDSLWSIVRPRLSANPIDMGRVMLSTSKDSVCRVLSNSDAFPVPVRRVYFKNSHIPFSLVSDDAPFTVDAGGQHSIEVRFMPQVRGVVEDSIFFETISGDVIGTSVRGEGIDNTIAVNVRVIDWKERIVGASYDTLQAVVRNIGTQALTFSMPTVVQWGSGGLMPVFELLGIQRIAQGNSFTVASGDSVVVYVRFRPPSVGRFSAPLQLTVTQQGVIIPPVLLFGVGIEPGPLLSITSAVPSFVQRLNSCQSIEQSIPIMNAGTMPLGIVGAEILAPDGTHSRDFSIVGNPVQEIGVGSLGTITVRFSPQVSGTTTATLIIRSNSRTGSTRIPLHGRQERPVLLFDRSVVVFPTVNPQQASPSVVVNVRNIGSTAASWFATPVDFRDSRGIPRIRVSAEPAEPQLAAQASGRLFLTFLGGEAGVTYTDNIQFVQGCFRDSLHWSATVRSAPAITYAVPNDEVITCASSATLTVQVRNNGTAEATTLTFSVLSQHPSVRIVRAPSRLAPQEAADVVFVLDTLLRSNAVVRFALQVQSTSGIIQTPDITVMKYDIGLEIIPRVIQFSALEPNTQTSATVTIINRSSQPLPIPSIPAEYRNLFRLESLRDTLAPYASLTARIVFLGASADREGTMSLVFSPLSVRGVGCIAAPETLIVRFSTLVPRSAHLVFTDAQAAPGDTAVVRVLLHHRVRVPQGTIIEDTLRLNPTLLAPLPPLPPGNVVMGERRVPIRLVVEHDSPDIPLAVLRFRVALGNDTGTVIRLSRDSTQRSPGMVITATPARFTLAGVARAGGWRLVSVSLGTVSILDVQPNPSSSTLTLVFDSRIADEYTVSFVAPNGMLPDPSAFSVQRFWANIGRNIRMLDVSRLPAGTYFLHVRNSREFASHRVVIMR